MGWQAWFTTLTGDPEQTLAGKYLTGDYLHTTGIGACLTGDIYLTAYCAICAWFSKLYLMQVEPTCLAGEYLA